MNFQAAANCVVPGDYIYVKYDHGWIQSFVLETEHSAFIVAVLHQVGVYQAQSEGAFQADGITVEYRSLPYDDVGSTWSTEDINGPTTEQVNDHLASGHRNALFEASMKFSLIAHSALDAQFQEEKRNLKSKIENMQDHNDILCSLLESDTNEGCNLCNQLTKDNKKLRDQIVPLVSALQNRQISAMQSPQQVPKTTKPTKYKDVVLGVQDPDALTSLRFDYLKGGLDFIFKYHTMIDMLAQKYNAIAPGHKTATAEMMKLVTEVVDQEISRWRSTPKRERNSMVKIQHPEMENTNMFIHDAFNYMCLLTPGHQEALKLQYKTINVPLGAILFKIQMEGYKGDRDEKRQMRAELAEFSCSSPDKFSETLDHFFLRLEYSDTFSIPRPLPLDVFFNIDTVLAQYVGDLSAVDQGKIDARRRSYGFCSEFPEALEGVIANSRTTTQLWESLKEFFDFCKCILSAGKQASNTKPARVNLANDITSNQASSDITNISNQGQIEKLAQAVAQAMQLRAPATTDSNDQNMSPTKNRIQNNFPRTTRVKGKVVRWSDKGFGFLKATKSNGDAFETELFVHATALATCGSLNPGDNVEFETYEVTRNGKKLLRAHRVTGGSGVAVRDSQKKNKCSECQQLGHYPHQCFVTPSNGAAIAPAHIHHATITDWDESFLAGVETAGALQSNQ